jgi:putative membrane protein
MKLPVVGLAAAACLGVPGAAHAQKVTDAEIAAIVVTANQVDIDAGKLAATRASAEGVRKFAQLMVTDHTGVNKSAVDLATRLKVTPQENATSKSLKSTGDKTLERLSTLKGAAFDKAYVDNEVAYHQQVIDALDTLLIPGATNAELKALLVKVRPAFVAHLEHAKSLQKTLAATRARTARRTHTVTIAGMKFTPASLSVTKGDTVIWVNQDLVPHTATAANAAFDSGTIPAGGSWRHTVTEAGRLQYACAFHPTMTGALRVG